MTKTYDLTPEQAYRLVLTALDVVGSVSSGVHDRIKRDADDGRVGSNPSVSAKALVALRQVLNDLGSGGLADRVITETHAPEPSAQRTYVSRCECGWESLTQTSRAMAEAVHDDHATYLFAAGENGNHRLVWPR